MLQVNEFLPYQITHRHLSFLSVCLILAKTIITFILFIMYPSSAYFSSITSANIIDQVNKERSLYGLDQLSANERLNRVAAVKLQDMLERQYFSHVSPDGEKVWPLLAKFQYDYSYAGENLAMNFYSAEDVVEAWMQSKKHKDNILSSNYHDIGVAVGTGELNGKTVSLVVQVFGLEYVSPVREFRKTVTSALSVSPGEEIVMGDSQESVISSKEESWYSWIPKRLREMLLLFGAMLSLTLFLLGVHESKQHHKTLAYGLFALCVIFFVVTVKIHFLEALSGPLVVG